MGGGGGLEKKLCVSEGRGFGDMLLDGFPPLLEVSRPCAEKPNSPRDEGERNVGNLTAALSTPWRNNVCIVEGVVAVLPSSPPISDLPLPVSDFWHPRSPPSLRRKGANFTSPNPLRRVLESPPKQMRTLFC